MIEPIFSNIKNQHNYFILLSDLTTLSKFSPLTKVGSLARLLPLISWNIWHLHQLLKFNIGRCLVMPDIVRQLVICWIGIKIYKRVFQLLVAFWPTLEIIFFLISFVPDLCGLNFASKLGSFAILLYPIMFTKVYNTSNTQCLSPILIHAIYLSSWFL